MVVMRGILIAVGLLVAIGPTLAQPHKTNSPPANLQYWESQHQSLGRDSTLIRLYAHNASSTANPDSALLWLQKGFKLALGLRSSTWLAYIHNRIGLVYLKKGVCFQAIEYLFKGLQYAEIAKLTSEQALSWDHIGDCYADLKKYEKAIDAENKAIGLYKLTKNKQGLASSLNDLGAVLSAAEQFPASIDALEKSLALSNSLQNPELLVATYHTLARTLLNKDELDQAQKYTQLAINTQIKTKGRANAELLALMSLIEALRNRPDESLSYAARAEIYLTHEWPSSQEHTAFNLFKAYKALQKPQMALLWHEKYVDLHEDNMKVNQEKRLEILRYEYDAQQLDTRLQLMADEMARESYLRWILVTASVIFLGLAAALFRSNLLLKKQGEELDATNEQLVRVGNLLKQANTTLEDRVAARTNELREANRALEIKNHEIQEALIRGQSMERKRVASELHNNLGSLLSGVKWRLESVEAGKLSPSEQSLHEGLLTLINDAYNQVRYISHNLLPSILEEQGLIPALKKLIADVNRPNKLTFDFIASKNVHIGDSKLAFELYSCVLELITNILKHAQARHVTIEIVQTDLFYVLIITDDGIGIRQNQSGQSGQGLENIRQRIKSLQGNFSLRALKSDHIPAGRDSDWGTIVTLRIPRQTNLVA